MLISENILAALNEQVGNEFSAFLQYTAIAAHFDRETLPLLAAHFYRQAEEEKQHAHKFIKFIVDTSGKLAIPAIRRRRIRFNLPRTPCGSRSSRRRR